MLSLVMKAAQPHNIGRFRIVGVVGVGIE